MVREGLVGYDLRGNPFPRGVHSLPNGAGQRKKDASLMF